MTAAARNIAICANKLIQFSVYSGEPSIMYRQSIQFPIKDSALREDVHALGALIGETLRDQGGEEFFKLVEGDRLAAIQPREGDAADAAELQRRTVNPSPAAATGLTRAVSIWFQALNTAGKVN